MIALISQPMSSQEGFFYHNFRVVEQLEIDDDLVFTQQDSEQQKRQDELL